MNRMLGYPSSGTMGLSFLGAESELDALKSTLGDIVSGAAAARLNSQRREIVENDEKLAAIRNAFNSLSPSQKTSQAGQAYQIANNSVINTKMNFNKAVQNYNEIAAKFDSFTLGVINPSRVGMAGLGRLGAAPLVLAAAIGAVLAASSWLIREFRLWWTGGQANINESRGLIDQAASAIKETGGVIRETGSTALKIAVAAGIGVGIWVLYNVWKGRRGRSAPMAALAAPTAELKSIEGSVIA